MPKLIYKGLEVGGVSNEAIQCHFDNTGSNIKSDNVEAALKELDSKTAGLIQVTPEEYEALAPEEKASGLYIIIDNKLSADGINPVQNKVIANAINALTSNITNKIKQNDTILSNIRFVFGEYAVSCNSFDDVTQRYVARFSVDKFSNFHNNTLAFIPIACFNGGYAAHLIDCSIDGNWVNIQSTLSTDSVVIRVLMVQYNV